jgi:hypothetical protein
MVFGVGRYALETSDGKNLIAQELTHVIQQTRTNIQGRPQTLLLQCKIGDGHDLANPRFKGEPRLEAAFDNETVIAVGSFGEAVGRVQEALLDLDFELPKFGVDCEFGSETQRAVRAFQIKNGALADGAVGPETMTLLDELAPSEPRRPATVCPTRRIPERVDPCILVGRCDPSEASAV